MEPTARGVELLKEEANRQAEAQRRFLLTGDTQGMVDCLGWVMKMSDEDVQALRAAERARALR